MKLKELLEKYSDVEITEEQEKHIKDLLGIKESKKWKPGLNEKYFFIDSYGDVKDEYTDHEQNAEWDDYRILINNCFQTKEEAEFRLEQIKVYNELKNFADENNEEIDWYSSNANTKYSIFCNSYNFNIDINGCVYVKDIGQIYFSSEAISKLENSPTVKSKIGSKRLSSSTAQTFPARSASC